MKMVQCMRGRALCVALVLAVWAERTVAETGDEYITDQGSGVYEVDATGGLTLADFSDTWTNAFLKSTDTFVFKGADDKGMSLDYTTPITASPHTNQYSHLVFDGGRQTLGWYAANKVNETTFRFAAGSTRENPALKVKENTYLSFFHRMMGGCNATAADSGAWVEIEPGATLCTTSDVVCSSSSLSDVDRWLFPTVIHPGATFQMSRHASGSRATLQSDTLFYVPETTTDDTRVATIDIDWAYLLSFSDSKCLGIDVGANANAKLIGLINGQTNGKYNPIRKTGKGTLTFTACPETPDRNYRFLVEEGTLIFKREGWRYAFAQPVISSGATFVLDSTLSTTKDRVRYMENNGTLRVTGAGTATLWNCQTIGNIETPDGAIVLFGRMVTKTDNRAAYIGEPIDRLTLAEVTAGYWGDMSFTYYPIVGHDDDYVYFNYVESLTNGVNAITGVHSLHAVNEDAETPTNITATASAFAIEGRTVTFEIDTNATLTVAAPVEGTITEVKGDGDLVLVNPTATILNATDFTGDLVVRGGSIVVPSTLEGRVTPEDGATVTYRTLSAANPHSVTFTVSGYEGTETLTNFPALVRLSETGISGFSYADVLADGQDLVFAAADSEAVYPCDVDTWNTNGESLVWVRIPELTNGAQFRMLYGSGPMRCSTAEATWKRSSAEGAGDYGAVWHMAEVAGAVADATGNDLTATPYKNDSTAGYVYSTNRAGVVGMARHIADPVSGQANLGLYGGPKLCVDKTAFNALGTIGKFSFSTWVRPDDAAALTDSYPRFFSCKQNNSEKTGFAVQVGKGTKTCTFFGTYNSSADSGKYTFTTDNSWAVGSWGHYVFVVNGTALDIYLNGTKIASHTMTTALVDPEKVNLFLGGANGEWSLAGSLDETRILCDAASADWVKADYDTQTKADFLTASSVVTSDLTSFEIVLKTVTSDSARLTADVAGKKGATCAVTVEIYDAANDFVTNVSRTVTCPLANPVELYVDGLVPSSNYTAQVTMKNNAGGVWTFLAAISTIQKVVLMTGDVKKSSFSPDKFSSGTSMCTHANNWSNTVDGTIHEFPKTGTDFDYVVDATKEADPTADGTWTLRTTDGGGGSTLKFYGQRLTIAGDRRMDTLRYTKGGCLSLMMYKYDNYTTTSIDELVLKNGTILSDFIDASNRTLPLNARIVIPYGYAGYFSLFRKYTNALTLGLKGSFVGEGTAIFCLYDKSDNNRCFQFESDLSGFTGKAWFNKIRKIQFAASSKPFADCPELTRDGITLDNRYYVSTETRRSGDNGASRIFFDADTTWATPNRGIIFADSGTTLNEWGIAIVNGATVTLENPLYGAAEDKGAAYSRFGLNGEEADYQTGTLVLKASEGDWAGTFALTNGTLVLAGSKPLGDGTLDAGGEAVVRIPSGARPYLKNATAGTKITVETPDDPKAGVEILRTSAACPLTRKNFNLGAGIPSDLTVRSHIDGDVKVYSLGPKPGLAIILR